MSADVLLARLGRVRKTGTGRWVACCPAHDDKAPSLSVRELPDGRVLLHCFAGCPVESVLSAVGLSVADLFPERIDVSGEARGERVRYERPRLDGASAVRLAHADILLAATIIGRFVSGGTVDDAAQRALWAAAGRLADLREAIDGR